MYDQIREDTIYIMLYAVVTAMAAIASFYLLFRRGNAFAADITPPRRLRRWTAAFFGVIAAGHLWYLPSTVLTSDDDIMLSLLIGALLDCVLTIPLVLVVMLCMLQDHRRPLCPVGVMVAPLVVGIAVRIVTRSEAMSPWLYGYFLLMAVGFTIYMVREVRRYGRWLRDNYADLEHKELWQSFVVLAVIMLMFVYYVVGYGGMTYEYIVQVCGLVLIGYLLWRVETLSDLSLPIHTDEAIAVDDAVAETVVTEDVEDNAQPSVRNRSTSVASLAKNIGPLLKQHCEEPQLYLQYDLSLSQLATMIGVNRSYLSKHFALQGITYNAYINGLRIQHFVDLCHERAATHQPLSVKQLALESGFRSYSTFNAAFQQVMGTTATEWLHSVVE